VKRFEADNPGIKIEVTTIPYPEFQQRLLTAVAGRQCAGCLHGRPDLGSRPLPRPAPSPDLGEQAKAAGMKP